MKRLLLVAIVAGCLPYPDFRPSPLEKRMHSQLAGKAKIDSHDQSSSFGVAYTAHRKERMDFELDAKGNLLRTQMMIPGAALPAAVRAAIPRKHIYEALVVFEHGTVTFFYDDGDGEDWTVDANGKVLSHTELGPDECDDDGGC